MFLERKLELARWHRRGKLLCPVRLWEGRKLSTEHKMNFNRHHARKWQKVPQRTWTATLAVAGSQRHYKDNRLAFSEALGG
jgi:hypothetical protein